ncbi:MAG: hypothetical protein JWM77_1800 [Rhodospirillales bacterium]|nr:hypothetical protein [Rhodospirillales bacterium]
MAASVAGPPAADADELGADFYGALLACVHAAECDGYAELKFVAARDDEVCTVIAALRGFAHRVRFALRAAPASIEALHLREESDGWPVEQVTIDPPPRTIVLVVQRRQGLVAAPAATPPAFRSIRSVGTAF